MNNNTLLETNEKTITTYRLEVDGERYYVEKHKNMYVVIREWGEEEVDSYDEEYERVVEYLESLQK